ncbi:MAG: D-alanine--D-alanine ligase [Myxococcales bacterium]|nr:D-alanine--D-alanine ligase [Myxococcales bacterium]
MRVCILMTEEDPVLNEACAPHLTPPGCYLPEHTWKVVELNRLTARARIQALVGEGWDVFLNLCDGMSHEDSAGIEVVHTLESLGAAFTGSGEGFYEPSRAEQKRVCAQLGILTPPCRFVTSPDAAEAVAAELQFPLIVKHWNGYASIGIDRGSKVDDLDGLRTRLAWACQEFGTALVEEFIDGREFTVLVSEPLAPRARAAKAWHPIECRFPTGETFKHYDLKWVDFAGMSWHSVEGEVLVRRLMDASRRMFSGLRGTGYARCDLRMDAAGRLYMLEINPNCGVFYPIEEYGSADFILANDAGGHAGFLDHMFQLAFRRQAGLQKALAGRGGRRREQTARA